MRRDDLFFYRSPSWGGSGILNLAPLLRGEVAALARRVRGKVMRGPDRKMIRIARRLRVDQTDTETVLWRRIRNRQLGGHKFVRQEPIGSYICDFVCREKLLVIEVDGGQHSESVEDEVRDRYLVAEGFKVLRFWNNDVLGNIEGVLITIQAALSK